MRVVGERILFLVHFHGRGAGSGIVSRTGFHGDLVLWVSLGFMGA